MLPCAKNESGLCSKLGDLNCDQGIIFVTYSLIVTTNLLFGSH